MKIRNILTGVLALAAMSCTDVLDKNNLSAITEKDVWSNADYTTAYLNKLYVDNLPGWPVGYEKKSDESYSSNDEMYGQLNINSVNTWNYTNIRNINILLDKIDDAEIDTETKQSVKAQALVLRAWKYFEMVRLYGGVPLILTAQDVSDKEGMYVTRNKTSECITQIISDLDAAASALPWTWSGDDTGRFTKASVMAFKSRVLLYWASPQFNPNNNTDRWQTAYTFTKDAITQMEANGYGLYDDFENIWFDEMNKEALFVKRYEYNAVENSWQAGTRPLEEAQNFAGYNHPTKEMVEAFPMADGVAITDAASGYDALHYWRNRDPRFYKTVAYNGCVWELSGKTGRIQWTYDNHTAQGPTESGFYCRKAVDVSLTPYETEHAGTDWIEIRFAEVLMNLAECAAALGGDKDADAYAVLKRIRQRAGIEAGADGMYGLKAGLSGDALMDAVLLERKIELAFEGKRYWDMRRHRLFAEVLNGKVRHGVMPILKVTPAEFDAVKATFDIETDYTTYFEDVVKVLDTKQTIDYKDNYYFFAIPQSHLQTNSKLEQTQGWDNGTFNPYE